jgi:hypothetical protein
MRAAGAAYALGIALASLVPAYAEQQWPWVSDRYFEDAGDADDDVSFAGLPDGTGFRTEGLTSCDCDLTANACDQFCCCDDACSGFERSTLFNCPSSEAVSARPGVYTCADASAVVSANLPDTSKAAWETDAEDPLARVLCVVADNSASYGAFIPPLEPLGESEVAAVSLLSNSSFGREQAGGTPALPTSSYYRAGQPLNRGSSGGDSARPSSYAPIAFPSAPSGVGALSAACVDSGAVRFIETQPPAQCVSEFAGGLEGACVEGSTLDGTVIAGASIGGSGLRPGAGGYERFTVSLAGLTYLQPGTGNR